MRYVRNASLTVLLLTVTTSAAFAQRTVRTSNAPAARERAWEVGFDAASVTLGMDAPKYLDVAITEPMARVAMFLSSNAAIEPRFSWFSSAQEKRVGVSSYTLDIGLLYGLSTMEPNDKPSYLRPSVMISGGSRGTTSRTTLSGAFGMRRQMHGVIMHNEISINRLLESGSFKAQTYIQVRHGLSFRRQ